MPESRRRHAAGLHRQSTATINTEFLTTISDRESAEGMQAIYGKYGISPGRIADVVVFAIDTPEDSSRSAGQPGPAFRKPAAEDYARRGLPIRP